MEVRVINAAEQRKTKNASIPLTAAVGGLTGFALKHTLPLGMKEINEYTGGNYNKEIRRSAFVARDNELANLQKLLKDKPQFEALDIFLKSKSSDKEVAKQARKQIQKGSRELRSQIRDYASTVAKKMRLEGKSKKYLLDSGILNDRPAAVFVVPGIVLGTIGAFVYNVIGHFKD